MKLKANLRKILFSYVLAASMLTVNALPGQISVTVKAAEGTETNEAAEEVTLQSVRDEAKARYETDRLGMDLDLSNQSFSGTGGLDYSSDTTERAYMQVFHNLKDNSTEQTILFRFKTTVANQFIFGTGVDGSNNGKNMTFSLENGKIRFRLRNCNKDQGGTKAGLQGALGSNLNDGKYHTVAVSFRPELGYEVGNVRFVIDGGSDIYPANWCPTWKAGFNQNEEEFIKFHIGTSALYGADGSNVAFDGAIDFITVIDKAYSVQELQKITRGDKDYTNIAGEMMAALTCHRWLFTGGTEGVADFAESKTTRNWVGLFEDNLRNEGSVAAGNAYIIRARFVFNTSRKGADVKEILDEYDTRILPYTTKTVGVMIGASDYQKGAEGLDAFVENLSALVHKLKEDDKYPLILTPYPSLNEQKQENISLYAQTIMDKANEWGIKAVDLSAMSTENNLSPDDRLTPIGHQAVANAIKNALSLGKMTNYTLDQLSDGSYTVAKQTETGEQAQVQEVTAGEDSIRVRVDASSVKGSTAHLEYTLTDTLGIEISASAEPGETAFTVEGLKQGETYVLRVYDAGRDTVRESYQPVCITVAAGETGISQEYEDGNISVNEKIQNLLTKDDQVTYLFMGDSITHGIVTNGYDNVPQMFAKYLYELGREKDVVLNTGVSNATLATTLDEEQIKGRLTNYMPDVVMIMLGTNDSSSAGENTVNGFGSTSQNSISVEEYVERYKRLVEKIYETNPDAAVVLRVPCDMTGQLEAHRGYEIKFAAIDQVAEEMREETGMDITVVNHLRGWRDYRDNVRNDNIGSSRYGWLVGDGVHPNGRGNLAMFQQIIKELGLYVPTSELANYQYELSEWTGDFAIEAPVTQKGSRASFEMEALSGYANGLRKVTLTLTADGRSISKTVEYDAEGIITVSGLDAKKTYTAAVTGTDAVNSKEIAFDASLTKETDLTATDDEKKEYTDSLTEAENLDLTEYPSEVQEIYSAALKEIRDTYGNSAVMTVDQIDAALTAIRLAQANIQKSMRAITQARENLKEALAQAKATFDGGRKSHYDEKDWNAFTAIYGDAERAVTDDDATVERMNQILADLKEAERKVLSSKTICPPPPGVEKNRTYEIGDYKYLVTDLTKRTVTLTGTTNANLSKLVVEDSVKLADGKFYQVTEVAGKAFLNHKKASSVQIGINVEKIGEQAFAKCAKLKKAVIKSTRLTEIGKKAFLKDKNLKSIDIKSVALKNVGKNAFKGTSAKLKITVPKAKYKAYVKKLAKKGQSKNAVIRKK